ncbi:hypothetical protein ACKX2L_06510 [Lachnospiraceae bacterium YH-ros2228]
MFQYSFQHIPSASFILSNWSANAQFSSYFIRAFENCHDEDSAFAVIQYALNYPIQQALQSHDFYGCVSREDCLQDIYLVALERFRAFRPFYLKVLKGDKELDVNTALDKGIISKEEQSFLQNMVDNLTKTIGTNACPFCNEESFTECINHFLSEHPRKCGTLTVSLRAVPPISYFDKNIRHAIAHATAMQTGIPDNDRKRMKRVLDGKEVPKKAATVRTLERIMQSGNATSFDAIIDEISDRSDDPNNSKISSALSHMESVPSAEDQYFYEQDECCLSAITNYQDAVNVDRNLKRRIAQKLFFEKQMERICNGDIDLSIRELEDMTEQILQSHEM